MHVPYRVDPLDPRAPSAEAWAAMDEAARARVLASLPSEVPAHLFMPEGDPHSRTKADTQDVLRRYFGGIGRRVYISGDLNVYYPEERVFAPDVIAVLDVDTHPRMSWVVSRERRGLDFVLEIHHGGERAKDFVRNVERYARLRIPEYFVFDLGRGELQAYRLRDDSARYTRVPPQGGRFLSEVLGVDFFFADGALRVAPRAGAALLDAPSLVTELESRVDDALARATAEREARDEALAQATAEREAREAEREAREAAEAELARLRARLAELEGKDPH